VLIANATYASDNWIYTGLSYTLPNNFDGLILTGTGLRATGNSQNGGDLGAYGADTLVAGSGDEELYSNTGFGTNTLVAGSGNDYLDAYAGDTIELNSGFGQVEADDDAEGTGATIRFGSGITGSSLTATAIDDEYGDGALAISNSTGAVTLDGSLSNTTYQLNFNGAGNLTLPQFLAQVHVATSSVTGASGNVILEGTASVSVTGGTGNDTIYAGATADTIKGGSGNQVLTAVGTNESIVGGSNSDTLTALGTNDTLVAGTALDTLVGGSGVNVTFVINNANDAIQLQTSPGTDTVAASFNFTLPTNINSLILTGTTALVGTANAGNDTLTANSGADTLVSGTTGTDSLVGGSGNDTFYVNNTADKVTDTSSTANNTLYSTVTYTLPTDVNTLILTGTAAIVGTGNTHTDSITAGAGVDTLVAGTGVATLIGGAGNDTFVINSASDVITDTSTSTSNTISSTASYTLPTNVNTLLFTGTSALKATGNSGNDSLTANTGADTLVAGSGIDTLVSGATGTDSLVGGTGNDLFFVNTTADKVTDATTSTSNTISSIVTYTLPTNVNALIFTGTAALQGTANSGSDSLTANTGADTLVAAGAGNDTLVSGTTGTDSLVGGTGSDTFVINNTADKVTDTSTSAANILVSSVTYTLPTDVNTLILSGTAALVGTGNAHTDSITAGAGIDTLVAGSAVATLIGGSGNDTFVINSASDVITDTSTTTSNTISSTVSYTLPTHVNALIFTGTAALEATGNTGNDSLTANTGADTLVAGSGTDTLVSGATGTDSLVGGTGNDLFFVNTTADKVTDATSSTSNTISSIVTYTLPTNVNALVFTGTAALMGTANSGSDSLTANTGSDTLVGAGAGNDTLVSGATGTDSLVGGTGNDTFLVNNTADIVTDTSSSASNTIVSSVNYTLPTDVQYLTLTSASALTGTGNSLLDLIVGNTGNDTLTAGSGIAALEGGRTAGSDQIKASSNQAALIGGAGASTITGGAFKDFYAAGSVSDSITTGATANVVSVNKGDGATTLAPTTSATNVLSLGAGIDTESLYFTKTGNNLILTDGVSGDSITFNNWYVGTADQDYTTLQVVEIASANYNSGGGDGLRNKALEAFNFTTLVAAYNAAGSPSNWALSTDMPSAQLSSSSTADFGGDLAYYFGLNGNLTGVDLSDVQSTLTNASFGTATQTINAFSGISGGGGLHLLATRPGGSSIQPVISPESTIVRTTSASQPTIVGATEEDAQHALNLGDVPVPHDRVPVDVSTPLAIRPRLGIEDPSRSEATSVSFVPAAAADAAMTMTGFETRRTIEPVFARPTAAPPNRRYVDPINVAWLTLHGALDEINDAGIGGTESNAPHEEMSVGALLGSSPADRLRSTVGDPRLVSPLDRRRAM
jgi:trimeric autotransporter adhesin